MVRFLNKAVNIRANEWPRFSILYAMSFLFVVGLIWGETTMEAGFLQEIGVAALPWFLVLKALASIPAFALYSVFADRIANSRLLIAILLGGSVALLAGFLLLTQGAVKLAYPLLYLIVFVPFYDIFAAHWFTYVNGFYDTRTAKRIIPVLGTANGLAAILAGFTLPLMNRHVTSSTIILFWVFLLLGIALLSWLMPRLLGERGRDGKDQRGSSTTFGVEENTSYIDNLREGFHFVTNSPFLRWMALSILLLMLLLTFVQYRTSEILLSEFDSSEQIANFIGILTAVTSIIMLPIQLFLLNRIINRVGVGNANLIYPVGAVLFSGSLIFLPASRLTAGLAYFTRTNFWYDFGYLVNSLLYNAVPLRVKGRARAFITGLVVPIAVFVGSVILLTPAVSIPWFIPAMIGLLAIAFLASMLMIREQYARALIAMLEQEDYSFLLNQGSSDLVVTDPAALRSLEQKLEESKSPEFTLFMAKLISDIGGGASVPVLERTARQSDAQIRARIIDILVASERQDTAIRQLYTDFLADPDPQVRQSALAGLEQLEGSTNRQYQELAAGLLSDPDINVRTQVIPVLLKAKNQAYQSQARAALSQMLESEDAHEQARSAFILGQVGDIAAFEQLLDCLSSPEDVVRLEAVLALEQLTERNIPEQFASRLTIELTALKRDPVERVRQLTLIILGRIGTHETHRTLLGGLTDSSQIVRETAVDVMVQIGKAIIPTVLPRLDSPDPQLRKMAVMILSQVNEREFGPLINSNITSNLLTTYSNYGYLLRPWATTNIAKHCPLAGHAEGKRMSSVTHEIFYLLTALHEADTIDIILQSLRQQRQASSGQCA